MKSYLFAWNPDKWKWPELKQDIAELKATGVFVDSWSCASHRSIRISDKAYIIKLGKEPRGIMGSGFVSSEPFTDEDWQGKQRIRVLINFEILIDPYKSPILPMDILESGSLAAQHWTTQSSGISIKPGVAADLEETCKDFLRENRVI
ncbi:hypothetical protein AAEO56_18730 [Flavobacterium sp. DGU11]|uniref:EVE domain-containing protein n=1 Tax=Flavobacterium arundinis TaxID=3139143 RepID=A0ABU9I1M2_9FLAO